MIGRHDFTSFRARRCNAKDPVRELTRVEVARAPAVLGPDDVVIELHGVSFVRHMARIITGTLVEVGASLRTPAEVAAALGARDPAAAGLTAPAGALTLVRVEGEWF